MEAVCVHTHLILESFGTGTKFKIKFPIPVLNLNLNFRYLNLAPPREPGYAQTWIRANLNTRVSKNKDTVQHDRLESSSYDMAALVMNSIDTKVCRPDAIFTATTR